MVGEEHLWQLLATLTDVVPQVTSKETVRERIAAVNLCM